MTASPHFSGTKLARMISFLRAHKRVITFALVALGAFWLSPGWEEGVPFYVFLLFFALFVVLIASQLFWICRVRELGKRMIPSKRWRVGLGAVGLLVYLFLLAFNLFTWNTESNKGSGLTLRAALLEDGAEAQRAIQLAVAKREFRAENADGPEVEAWRGAAHPAQCRGPSSIQDTASQHGHQQFSVSQHGRRPSIAEQPPLV